MIEVRGLMHTTILPEVSGHKKEICTTTVHIECIGMGLL